MTTASSFQKAHRDHVVKLLQQLHIQYLNTPDLSVNDISDLNCPVNSIVSIVDQITEALGIDAAREVITPAEVAVSQGINAETVRSVRPRAATRWLR